jgi:HAD superfamily hydrolase (TIGR01509 family)
MIEAVVFDLDGVLIDSEPVWEHVRRGLVAGYGGRWPDDAQQRLMGMSTQEWARYLSEDLGIGLPPDEVARLVIRAMAGQYQHHLPLLPGAVEAVRSLAGRWPLGLASSSNREIIDLALELAGLADAFAATVSSEEVERGKPAPDVYLEAARRLRAAAARCVAIEDSSNGLRAAAAAEMPVIAVPNPHYPPSQDALALAAATIDTLHELTPELVERVGAGGARS